VDVRDYDDGAAKRSDWDAEFGCWRCHCGTALPHGVSGAGTMVTCPRCGDVWQYGHWALRRWPGDGGSTGLEPRRIYSGGYPTS